MKIHVGPVRKHAEGAPGAAASPLFRAGKPTKRKKRGQGGTKGGYIESYYIRSCPEYDPEPKRDIPEERGGQRLKYDIDKVMLLTRAGMTEADICRRMGGMPIDTLRRYKAILRRKGKLC